MISLRNSENHLSFIFNGYVSNHQKIRWVTYWFRLHNTTLFFYSKKEGRAVSTHVHFWCLFSKHEMQLNKWSKWHVCVLYHVSLYHIIRSWDLIHHWLYLFFSPVISQTNLKGQYYIYTVSSVTVVEVSLPLLAYCEFIFTLLVRWW